jgi:hypothetical protein
VVGGGISFIPRGHTVTIRGMHHGHVEGCFGDVSSRPKKDKPKLSPNQSLAL